MTCARLCAMLGVPLLATIAACSGGGSGGGGGGPAADGAADAAAADGAADAAAADAAAADATPPPDANVDAGPQPLAPFPRGLVATDQLGELHGYKLARAIVHLHSLYSHDACDGQPLLADGTPNEQCLRDLHRGFCEDNVDFALLTEHYGRMADTLDFNELFLQRNGDTWVDEDGHHAASAMHCPNGDHVALVMPGLEGGEAQVSPVGLTGHPAPGSAAENEAAYQDGSAAGVARLRALGAVPLAIHLEGQDPAWLAATDLDAVEIGNLHVLIAPNLRTELGLEPAAPSLAFATWLQHPADNPPPDLVFLEFHQRLPGYAETWDGLLAVKKMAGFLGNDAHRNVLPTPMGDGERPDSYRRMMKWYVNHLLVSDRTPAQAREALSRGRSYMVFEVLGSPLGFDFWAERADGGQTWVMGDVADSAGQPTTVVLRASKPQALLADVPADVVVTLQLYRVTEAGSEMVQQTDGALTLPAPGPGRYRVELEITPTHLAPWLAGHEALIHPYPWVYSNAIEVR